MKMPHLRQSSLVRKILALGTGAATLSFGASAFAYSAPNISLSSSSPYVVNVYVEGGGFDPAGWDNSYRIQVRFSDGTQYTLDSPSTGAQAASFQVGARNAQDLRVWVQVQERWSSIFGAAGSDWSEFSEQTAEGRLDGTIRSAWGTCVDVPGGVAIPGTLLQNWQCLPGDYNQLWSFDTNHEFVAGSGLVMDVYGYGETNGTRADVYPSDGRGNQLWNLASAQVLGMGDQCLDDSGYGGEGTPVGIYTCHGSQNQIWNYDFWSEIIFGYDGNCLQASGLPIGTGVVMNGCGQAGETWQILPGGLIKNLDTEKCIDLPNWDFNNSTDVVLTACDPTRTSQKFAWKGNITTPIDNACLDLQAGNTSNGTPIQMWSCLANDLNQEWYFSP